MYKVLRKHAIDNVWCSPKQDNQIIVKAKRITVPGGELVSATVMMRHIKLPTTGVRYHIYQVGHIHPVVMGLLPRQHDWMKPAWKKFSDAVNTLSLFANLYSDKGVHSPLHRSYYMYTEDRALIFAVPQLDALDLDLYNEAIYLRLYSNAYYDSEAANSLLSMTNTDGCTVLTVNDITRIQSQVNGFMAKPGAVFCYVNGNLTDDISPLNSKVGDVIEYVYDASVKETVDLQVGGLRSFSSVLDGQTKYLLHRPKVDGENQIEYIDDIDLYVVAGEQGRRVGRFMHRNDVENHRMVTHRDHSVSASSYAHIERGLSDFLSIDTAIQGNLFSIRMYVRNSGLNRPLVYENQRIFEMYKMNDGQILNALAGLDATMDIWKASTLENSDYVKLMRSDQKDIDIDMIEGAYGYSAITKIIGERPLRTRPYSSRALATLPPVYHDVCTVYEYDENGHLLGYYPSTTRNEWFCTNDNAAAIEPIVGVASDTPSVTFGKDNIYIKPGYSFRVYKADVFEGQVQTNWEDITGSNNYDVVNDRLVWKGDAIEYMLQVRTDETFLAYSMDVNTVAGTLYFDLTEVVNDQHQVMSIPAGHLDIWLNGKPIIRELDYVVKFPRVYILSKEHMAQPAHTTPQRIDIRFTGFCDSDLNLRSAGDYGWVQHGYLSNNDRHDLRDDKVLRIVLRGSLKFKEDLEYSEEHLGVSLHDAENGSPYQIVQSVIPLRYHSESETYAMLEKSEQIDRQVGQYLTQKLPQPSRGNISVIPNRYQLVSPFFAHLVSDLENNQFDKDEIQGNVSDNKVMELCKPYEWLLEYDPISDASKLDMRYVVIHPHFLMVHIALDLPSFSFLQKVVKLYGRNKVVLNNHLTVKTV